MQLSQYRSLHFVQVIIVATLFVLTAAIGYFSRIELVSVGGGGEQRSGIILVL